MCKLLILTSHKPSQRDALIASAWTYFNATGETDGFGAAWVSRTGEISYRRSSAPVLTIPKVEFIESFADSAHTLSPSDGGFLLVHGRKATCGIELGNTHPMLSESGAALIHNGVVTSKSVHNISTTCDSELLLRAMESGGVNALAEISGYYAFGMIQPVARGHVLHVAKDGVARLKCGRTRSGWAFATTDEALALAGVRTCYEVRKETVITFADGLKHAMRDMPAKPVIPAYSPGEWRKDFPAIKGKRAEPIKHNNGESFRDYLGEWDGLRSVLE